MFCRNCGKQMADNSDFCPECGAQQPFQQSPIVTKQKVKKPLHKKWWFWVIAIFLLIGALGAIFGDPAPTEQDSLNSTPQVTPAISDESAGLQSDDASPSTEPTEEVPVNDPEMTADEFEAIEMGLTYDEVVEIVGGEGELLSESDIGMGDAYIMQIYTWEGNGSFGSNANVTFQGGVAISKAQIGLK